MLIRGRFDLGTFRFTVDQQQAKGEMPVKPLYFDVVRYKTSQGTSQIDYTLIKKDLNVIQTLISKHFTHKGIAKNARSVL